MMAGRSFDLYYGLFLYNQNATDELERLQRVGRDSQCICGRERTGWVVTL